MNDRGKPLDAPSWWLELARQKVSETGGLVELGAVLARHVRRGKRWHHSVLSKFATGEKLPTQELATALSLHFDLPMPFFIPATINEAKAMQAISALSSPEDTRTGRERTLEQELDTLERKVGGSAGSESRRDSQSSNRLDSTDGVTRPDRRGPRGVRRGR